LTKLPIFETVGKYLTKKVPVTEVSEL